MLYVPSGPHDVESRIESNFRLDMSVVRGICLSCTVRGTDVVDPWLMPLTYEEWYINEIVWRIQVALMDGMYCMLRRP